jgi:hypothetical protein
MNKESIATVSLKINNIKAINQRIHIQLKTKKNRNASLYFFFKKPSMRSLKSGLAASSAT